MSLSDYQKHIDDELQKLEKPYWHPLSQFARIAEEVGELGRLLNHIYGDKPKKASESKQELPDEIADILFAVICVANSHDINLDDALEKAIDKLKDRDANRFKKK